MNPPTSGSTASESGRPGSAPHWRVWFPDEKVFGPLTSDELKELVKQKVLTADCRLQREGKSEWLLPSQVLPKTFPAVPRPAISPQPSQASTPPPSLPLPSPPSIPPATNPTPGNRPPATHASPIISQEPLIVAEIASLPQVHAPTATPPPTALSAQAHEGLGMLFFGGIGALLVFAVLGLVGQFGAQHGWDGKNNSQTWRMLVRGGIAVVCGFAAFGAFVAKSAFAAGEERAP